MKFRRGASCSRRPGRLVRTGSFCERSGLVRSRLIGRATDSHRINERACHRCRRGHFGFFMAGGLLENIHLYQGEFFMRIAVHLSTKSPVCVLPHSSGCGLTIKRYIRALILAQSVIGTMGKLMCRYGLARYTQTLKLS